MNLQPVKASSSSRVVGDVSGETIREGHDAITGFCRRHVRVKVGDRATGHPCFHIAHPKQPLEQLREHHLQPLRSLHSLVVLLPRMAQAWTVAQGVGQHFRHFGVRQAGGRVELQALLVQITLLLRNAPKSFLFQILK